MTALLAAIGWLTVSAATAWAMYWLMVAFPVPLAVTIGAVMWLGGLHVLGEVRK